MSAAARGGWRTGAALGLVLALAAASPAFASSAQPEEIEHLPAAKPVEQAPAAEPAEQPSAAVREGARPGDDQRSAVEKAAGGGRDEPGSTRTRTPRPSRDLTEQIRTVGEGEATPPAASGQSPGMASAAPGGPVPVCRPAKVASEDEFIELLRQAAATAGMAPGAAPLDPRDAQTEFRWNNAMAQEQAVQERLMRDLAALQGEVSVPLNAYLAATDRWQSSYVNVTSSSTALQGLLTEWLEARKVYERADLAFALANLGVGVGKLGFKGYRWVQARRAAAQAETVAATSANAATRAADARRALENTPLAERYAPVAGVGEAGSTYRVAGQAGIGGELAAAEATQNWVHQLRRLERSYDRARADGASAEVLDRLRDGLDTLRQARPGAAVPPVSVAGLTAAEDAAALAAARAHYAQDLANTERNLAEAAKQGDLFLQEVYGKAAAELRARGAPTSVARAPTAIEQATTQVGARTLELARQYGVDARPAIARLAAGQIDEARSIAAEMEVLAEVARAKGWHPISPALDDLLNGAIIQGRRVLAGVEGAQISPATVAALRRLEAALLQRNAGLGRYLDTAAATVGGIGPRQLEGIGLLFARSDVDLILKILQTGGNAARLRGVVSPVAQASLNGLARGMPGLLTGNCATAAEGLLKFNMVAGTGAGLPGLLVAQPQQQPSALVVPTLALSDQQLANVLDGTGELGNVGLVKVVDQFGITDRFTQGQGLARAVAGEMWELLTSPSATTASFYYTFEAQKEYLNLLTGSRAQIVQLGVALDDAARALRDLQEVLSRADGRRYLDAAGPAELKQALDELQQVFDGGSSGWKNRHRSEMAGRRAHITQKLADLDETRTDLRTIAGRMGQLRAWLDSVRLGPGGKPRTPIEAFNPLTFVRLGSIDRYLRGMGADAFGLMTDTPFHMVLAPPDPDFGFEAERKRYEEQARKIDAAQDVDIDPSVDAWLNTQGNR